MAEKQLWERSILQDLKGDVLGVQTSQLERRPVDTVSGLELSLSSGWPGDGSSS